MTSPEQGPVSQELQLSRDVMALSHETASYRIEPGNPESRKPLKGATAIMHEAGLEGDVVAEIRLGGGDTPTIPAEKNTGLFNIWLVKSESGDFALVNADVVEQIAKDGEHADESFMDTFATELHNDRTVVIGTKNTRLGMDDARSRSREYLDFISRSHVKVTIYEVPDKAGVSVEIEDISTNGTTLVRGPKEGNVFTDEKHNPELITGVPSFGTQESADESENDKHEAEKLEKISALQAELNDPKFEELRKLYTRRDRHLSDKRDAQIRGDGQGSIKYGQYAGEVQGEIKSRYSELNDEYRAISHEISSLMRKSAN